MEFEKQSSSDEEKDPKDAEIITEKTSEKKENTETSAISAHSEKRLLAASAYFVFFLPLLLANKDALAMYHANQGLLLLLTAIAINIVGTFIPFFGWFFVLPLGGLFVFILAIMGIINAFKGEKKPLPLIGKYPLLDMLK